MITDTLGYKDLPSEFMCFHLWLQSSYLID
jgi:hypothetical protein